MEIKRYTGEYRRKQPSPWMGDRWEEILKICSSGGVTLSRKSLQHGYTEIFGVKADEIIFKNGTNKLNMVFKEGTYPFIDTDGKINSMWTKLPF